MAGCQPRRIGRLASWHLPTRLVQLAVLTGGNNGHRVQRHGAVFLLTADARSHQRDVSVALTAGDTDNGAARPAITRREQYGEPRVLTHDLDHGLDHLGKIPVELGGQLHGTFTCSTSEFVESVEPL